MSSKIKANCLVRGKSADMVSNRTNEKSGVKSLSHHHRLNQLFSPICLHEIKSQHEIGNHYRDLLQTRSNRVAQSKSRRPKPIHREQKKRRFAEALMQRRIQAQYELPVKRKTLKVSSFTIPGYDFNRMILKLLL